MAIPACLQRVSVLALAAALGLAPTVAAAQGYAQQGVQALPDPAALQLSESLRALARDPRSLTALLAAAEASLALDDVDAAMGFVQRAEAVAPGDGRVTASRAALLVRQQRPIEALALFAAAEQQGGLGLGHVAERGLAFDLVGDNSRAQQDYSLALAAGPDPRVSRRLALSQAIAGNQQASEATLLPLLQRSDLAAYRTRAFALAILGRTEEAVSIAETMLPERLSGRLAPYLRYMPRLTRAQQAAAANLGAFPQAAQIGRDDPALAAYSPQAGPTPAARTADSRLVPSGPALGSPPAPREGGIPRREEVTPPRVAAAPPPEPPPAAPQPQPQVVLAAASNDLPAPEYGPPPAAQSPAQAGAPVMVVAAEPEPAPEQPEPQPSLAEAFAEFGRPGQAAPPAAGAVDITQIRPRREAPRVEAPARPVHPARQWVQVATGRDTAALAFDWRRIKREADGLLDRSAPHTARWGQTNRLVVGPFSSTREADALVARLKDKDVDSFRFGSAAGEEVKPLS